MKLKNFAILVVTLSLLAFLIGLVSEGVRVIRPYEPINIRSLRGSGHIVFIPIGKFPRSKLQSLANYYQDKYGINIEIRSTHEVPSEAYDPIRKQLIAENLIASLTGNEGESNGELNTIIGITNRDMYIRHMNWRYAFSLRNANFGVGVISSARMNDAFHGEKNTGKAVPQNILGKLISWMDDTLVSEVKTNKAIQQEAHSSSATAMPI